MQIDVQTLLLSVALCFILALLVFLVVKLLAIERGARAALQNVQLQLSFIAGRIGLNNKDLQAATMRKLSPEEPAPPPEVIGGTQWNDFEELIDRAERGEIDLEETPRAG